MFSGNKITSVVLGIAVLALAVLSGWLYVGQKDTQIKLVQLEKRINEVSGNEKDTAKEVARMLGEFDAIAK
jgi:cell division protein FtsL